MARSPEYQCLEALFEYERQYRAAFIASLSVEARRIYPVVHAQFNLENRQRGHAQAVIHCPVGVRLLQTECNNNMQRAWFFLTDVETGVEWCIFVVASTHYLNRTAGGTGDDTTTARLLADTVVRHTRNQPQDVELAARVQAHLLARRPLKVFRRCPSNEMEAVGYGRAVGSGSAFIQTTVYPSVGALALAYPTLAKPSHTRRAQDAVGQPQVRFDLVVRTTPWPTGVTSEGLSTAAAAPATAQTTAQTTAAPFADPSEWSTLLAAMSAAK